MRRPPEQSTSGETGLDACEASIISVSRKADHNERLARWSTAVIVISSALIPVFLLLSTQGLSFIWGKLVPALLAMTSALAAGILQFERPHDRWRLYRNYQRAFEDQRLRFQNSVDPYEGLDKADGERLLAVNVADLRLRLDQDWAGLVPASASIASEARPPAKPGGS